MEKVSYSELVGQVRDVFSVIKDSKLEGGCTPKDILDAVPELLRAQRVTVLINKLLDAGYIKRVEKGHYVARK